MSRRNTPIESFGKLSIKREEDMPAETRAMSRARAQIAARLPPTAVRESIEVDDPIVEEDGFSSGEEEQEDDDNDRIIAGASTDLFYDVSDLDEASAMHANAGLIGDGLSLTYCRYEEASRAYKFHMTEQIGVLRCQFERPPTSSFRLLRNGASVSAGRDTRSAFELVHSKGLGAIAARNGWQVQDTGRDQRNSELVDMLSVFDPDNVLPHEYDEMEDMDNRSERSLLYKRFGDLITELCLDDPTAFARIRQILTDEMCTTIHLEKVRERIFRTFNQLDAFISRGPSDSAKSVPDTADTLYDIVETIDDLLKSRPAQPSRTLRNGTASILLHLLEEVNERNVDAYERVQWSRRPSSNEAAVDRNLWLRLIGRPSPGKAPFAVTVLQDLPRDVFQDRREQLDRIERRLAELGAPDRYIAAVARLSAPMRRTR
ncbi:hypothetical protein LTR66_008870 [Elasticomyces elasticus]|nr:hypothetical protein LTR66_008870 [Elasticomyces elasticus]KAK5005686.1 hypothetical protein LTR28_007408 [Elasticomyces elasticus]